MQSQCNLITISGCWRLAIFDGSSRLATRRHKTQDVPTRESRMWLLARHILLKRSLWGRSHYMQSYRQLVCGFAMCVFMWLMCFGFCKRLQACRGESSWRLSDGTVLCIYALLAMTLAWAQSWQRERVTQWLFFLIDEIHYSNSDKHFKIKFYLICLELKINYFTLFKWQQMLNRDKICAKLVVEYNGNNCKYVQVDYLLKPKHYLAFQYEKNSY